MTPDLLKYPLIWALRAYRFAISPLYGQVCRYHPSCSAYALEAVTRHGSLRGSWLAVRRLARCHPWASGGVDPVPEVPTNRRTSSTGTSTGSSSGSSTGRSTAAPHA